jgi:hypothetical protein
MPAYTVASGLLKRSSWPACTVDEQLGQPEDEQTEEVTAGRWRRTGWRQTQAEVEREGAELVREIDANGAEPESKQIEAGGVARRGSGGEGAPPGARWSKEIQRRRGDHGADQAEDDRATWDPASGEDGRGTELDFGHIGIAR